jgi:hypothetical protein
VNKKDNDGGKNEEEDVSSLKDDIDRKVKLLQEMVERLWDQHGQTGPWNDSKGGEESNVRPEDGEDGGKAPTSNQATAYGEGAGIATLDAMQGRGEGTMVSASDATVDDLIDRGYHDLALVEQTMQTVCEPTTAAALQATALAGRTKIKGLLKDKAANLKIALRCHVNGPAKDEIERDIEDTQGSIAAIEAAEHEATKNFRTPPRSKGIATSHYPGTAFSRMSGTGATPTGVSFSIPTEMSTDKVQARDSLLGSGVKKLKPRLRPLPKVTS